MKKSIYVWKSEGLTPLQAINKFKEQESGLQHEIISYAGRLDPMAEGILILLIGDENKNRDKYLKLRKVYEAEIIIGISTDTYDALGIVKSIKNEFVDEREIKLALSGFKGKQKQKFPPFSSKTVKGKPLFWWIRNNKLNEIRIPEKDIEIYELNLHDYKKVLSGDFIEKVINKIEKVTGDFRQKEIIDKWREIDTNKEFVKIKIMVECSSGTYIRGIANQLGEILKTGAITYSIKRIKIGDISKKDCIKLI
jgi:tRNA pseudouridine55 synthase